MPYRYAYLLDLNLKVETGRGLMTGPQVLTGLQESLRHPDCRPGVNWLLDMRPVQAFDLHIDEMHALVQHDADVHRRGHYGDYKAAIIPRHIDDEMLVRLYNLLTHQYQLMPRMEVFHSLPRALQWLGVAHAEPRILDTIEALSTP